MSDLAAMLDMDDTTNDDTSMVLDDNIQDSRHRPAQMDILDFQIFPTARFLAKEDQVPRIGKLETS